VRKQLATSDGVDTAGAILKTRQLEQAIRQYIQINNTDPRPFNWAKLADDILASVKRFCLRISNSGH
jgi:hypothetical protein